MKCKLRSVAHEAYKRASFFLRYFCLHRGEVLDMNISTMRHCMNQVCARDPRGARVKGEELGDEMRLFWDSKFSSIYQEKVDMRCKSALKQLVAQQMLDNILVDVKTHFESRLRRVVRSLLERKCPGYLGDASDVESKKSKKSLWRTVAMR